MPYQFRSDLESPSLNQKIWRYMDLAKFIALLQNRSLYFPSLGQLIDEDPWEGLPSKLNFNIHNGSTEENSVVAPLHEQSYLGSRDSFYVNCWHMNNSESISQWKYMV